MPPTLNTDFDQSQHSQKPPDDLLDYIEVIAKRWRLIVKVIVISAVLSIIFALLLPKIYSSTSLIIPPQQDNSMMSMLLGSTVGGIASGLSGGILGMSSPAEQYASMLESNRISDVIIDKFKLLEVYGVDYRIDMYKKLDKLVDIKAGKKDGIISITVENEDPKRAADIANEYVAELGRLVSELSMTGGEKNKEFFERRLSQSRVELAKAEDEIKKFQGMNKTIDVTEQAKASIAGIAELRAQQALQEVQLAGLSRRFTENSQEVKDAKTAISRIKSQIEQLEGGGKGGAIPRVGSMPEIGQEYVRLMREFKKQETLVELLTKQYELAKLVKANDTPGIQIIQKARVPDKKIKPKRTLIVIGVTCFSFACTVFWVLLSNYLNKLSHEDQVNWRRIKSAIGWNHSSNKK